MFFLLRSATQKIRRWLGDLNSLLMIARWKIFEALSCCSCAQRLSNLMNFYCPQFNFQTQKQQVSPSFHSWIHCTVPYRVAEATNLNYQLIL